MTEKKKKKGWLRIVGIMGIVAILVILLFIALLVWGAIWWSDATKAQQGSNGVVSIRKKVAYFYEEHCKFPHSASSSALLPKNWERVVPDYSEEGWKEIKYSSDYKGYFRYRMINEGASFRIVADANFDVKYSLLGKDRVHSATTILTPGPGCTVISSPIRVKNRFK